MIVSINTPTNRRSCSNLRHQPFVLPEPKRLKGEVSGGAETVSGAGLPADDDLPF